MLTFAARQAVTRLTEAMLSVRPLVDVLAHPVRVTGDAGLQGLVDRVGGRLGAPPLAVAPGGVLDTFERVVSERLGLDRTDPALASTAPSDVDSVVDDVVAEDLLTFCRQATVGGPEGPLRAYAAGDPQAPPVVLVSACGMPARLAEPWLRRLAKSHLVLTWESRGLFGDNERLGGRTGVPEQAGDLFAVMDHFGVRSAHLAGLCGGAVLALAAAARTPERVTSLSLWHGDFELGDAAPKTGHQRNLQALLAMAARGRASAADLHAVLCQSLLATVAADLAHLVLYPYATPALLLRYCQLNGAIMEYDVRPVLPSVRRPTLVVTSRDDSTAHPDGSRYVAALLPDARLVVTAHGDHLSLFRGDTGVLDLATRFIAGEEPEVSR